MSISLSAQKNALSKAHQAFEDLEFSKAIQLYESYLKNNQDVEAQSNLAEAYLNTSKYKEAESLFEKIITQQNANGDQYLKYSSVLLINGKKQKAANILQEYIIHYPSTEEYKRLFNSINLSPIDSNKAQPYKITKSEFNSSVSDFSPAYLESQLVYTTQQSGKKDPWTGRSYSNLYITSDDFTKSKKLPGNLNGKFHNGAATFMSDEYMIFTRNNSKKGKNRDYNLILAFAKKEGIKWNYYTQFEFNNKEYSNAYPTYLPSQKILIFSSDMPGGYGGMDLYYSKYQNKKWSTPINLGPKINTSGEELFPYVTNSTLYFSSTGYPGMGGIDIYAIPFNLKFGGKITHLPYPINSSKDDFGLITKDELKTGYFSSNREGGGAIDNIYSFKAYSPPPQSIDVLITGKVIDQFTKIPLKDVSLKIIDQDGNEAKSHVTAENGRFSFEVESNKSYRIIGSKNGINTTEASVSITKNDSLYYYTLLHNDPRFSLEGYALDNKSENGVAGVKVICFNKTKQIEETTTSDEKGFFKFQLDQDSDFEISGTKDGFYTSVSEATTKGLERSKTLYVNLFLSVEKVVIGDTRILGKETFGGHEFDPIYYDLDKYNIREDAALALNKVVEFMLKNPTLKIELGAHTDSRARDDYNLKLSNNRANAAVSYIITQGIAASRIVSKGYGETRLVNGCKDGIPCTEQQHQLNRRTEIKVIGVN